MAWAQDSAPTPPPGGGLAGMLVPFLLVFVIFYLLIFRPQQKQQKQKKAMLEQLKRGDEVVTAGGIYGKVADFRDANSVALQIAANVTIRIDRAQIQTVLSPPEPVKANGK